MNPFISIGVLINSALYLTGCFVAGMVTHNSIAWRLALAGAGMTYVAYAAQGTKAPYRVMAFFVLTSIALGLFAGLALIGG